jgi:hypothetical protein
MDDRKTVKEEFTGYFTLPRYDGTFDDLEGQRAERDFRQLVGGYYLNWSQVHGSVKDRVKAAMFVPYEHWTELYDSARRVVRVASERGMEYWGPLTNARLMGDTMAVLRAMYEYNAPRWWLPIMRRLRAEPN